MENYKTCTKCGQLKAWSAFSIKKKTGTPRSECRICNCARSVAWAKANPELQRQWQRDWDRKNPHKKEWTTNKPKAIARQKEYYTNHRAQVKETNQRYHRTVAGWLTKTLSSMRKCSKDRGHQPPVFEDREHLRQWALSQPHFESLWAAYESSGFELKLKPSIDRLDNHQGYTLSNIRLVTWEQNYRAWLDSEDHRGRQRKRFKEMWQQIKTKGTADKVAGAGEL